MVLKPVKIKLNNNTASGMYVLLTADEVKFTKDGETKPPNRSYKIEVAVEQMHNNKRCRGKTTFTIAKGTSIVKAVGSLLGKKDEMKDTLKANGTLKVEKKTFKKIDSSNRKFKAVYSAWITNKSVNASAGTIKSYNGAYNGSIHRLDKFIIDDITTDDIQDLVNWMIAQGKSASTIGLIKPVLKPLLAVNDVLLNWKKIEFPKVDNERKYKGTDDEAKLIAKTLLGYKHPVARGVFTFLLTGRRIGEIMQMEYSHLDYSSNSFTLPKETTKTNTEVTYGLTPELINAINIQKTTTGLIFDLKAISVHYHFKKAMQSIGIHNMVMHDIRSMVAVVSLRNGADIYSVSKMLSHKDLSTTQKRYIGNDVSQAAAAQDTFTAVIAPVVDVIDVDVVDDEFTALKAIYPTATDDMLHYVMEMMK